MDFSTRQAGLEIERELQARNKMLDAILNASLNAIMTLQAVRDPSGTIVDLRYLQVNDAFTRMTGRSADETVGNTMLHLFPSTGPQGIFDLYKNVIETGRILRTELKYEGEGLDAVYLVSATVLDEESMTVTFDDITERERSKEQLQQTLGLFQEIIDHLQSGVLILSPVRDEGGRIHDFTVMMANGAALAYSEEEPTGRQMSHVHPAYLENGTFQRYTDAYQRCVTRRSEVHYEGEGIDGWFDEVLSRVGENLLVTFTEFTHLKRLQEQLEATVSELKRSNANLEEFTYAASHDLKEPLRKIHYYAERLKGRIDFARDEEGRQMFDRMEIATLRMRALIDDLLTYSHTGLRTDVFVPVPLDEVVQEVLSDMEASVLEKGAVVEADSLPVVMGDRRQLRQLFQNLFSNSLKYSQEGVPPRLAVRARPLEENRCATPESAKAENWYEIRVEDNGIGFEQEHAERIFQVFQRLHGRMEYSGTGVGLAIVRKVVENHRGCIRAQGRPGQGALFIIELPGE